MPAPKAGERNRLWDRLSTLRFQILGIVITCVLVPSFLAGWFASDRIDDLLRSQVYSEIRTRTERLSEKITGWVNNRSGEVRAFTSSYLLNEDLKVLQGKSSPAERQRSRRNINRYLAYLLEGNDYISAIGVLDAGGSVLVEQPPGSWRLPAGSVEQPSGSEVTVKEFQDDNRGGLLFSVRMGLGSDIAPVTLAALMGMEHLRGRINELAPEGSVVYLLDLKGDIKTSNVETTGGDQAPPEARALLENSVKSSIYSGLEGIEVIATGAMLEQPRWGVVLETSRDRAFLPLAAFRRQILLMALGLAAVFLLPALMFARNLVLPLEELSRVSRRIRSGKPGLQVKSKVGGELGELIKSFNSMSASLQESLDEITSINQNLHVMSITDALTGRYNRRYIEDYLTRELELALRTKEPLTVLMIDLDHFKKYNDTYGHIAGDEALKQLGNLLVGTVRKTDVVARYGGEEWIICLSHTNKAGGAKIAEKLRQAVQKNDFLLKGEKTRITISIGIATVPEDGASYAQILEAADSALYSAKESGRNQIRTFTAPGSS